MGSLEAPELPSQQAGQPGGHCGQEAIKAHVEGHGRAQRIEVEDVHRLDQPVLDDHTPGVPEDQRCGGRPEVVRQEHGRLLVRQVFDDELAKWARVLARADPLLDNLGRLLEPLEDIEAHRAPGRPGLQGHRPKQGRRAAPEGEESPPSSCNSHSFREAVHCEPSISRCVGFPVWRVQNRTKASTWAACSPLRRSVSRLQRTCVSPSWARKASTLGGSDDDFFGRQLDARSGLMPGGRHRL